MQLEELLTHCHVKFIYFVYLIFVRYDLTKILRSYLIIYIEGIHLVSIIPKYL